MGCYMALREVDTELIPDDELLMGSLEIHFSICLHDHVIQIRYVLTSLSKDVQGVDALEVQADLDGPSQHRAGEVHRIPGRRPGGGLGGRLTALRPCRSLQLWRKRVQKGGVRAEVMV